MKRGLNKRNNTTPLAAHHFVRHSFCSCEAQVPATCFRPEPEQEQTRCL